MCAALPRETATMKNLFRIRKRETRVMRSEWRQKRLIRGLAPHRSFVPSSALSETIINHAGREKEKEVRTDFSLSLSPHWPLKRGVALCLLGGLTLSYSIQSMGSCASSHRFEGGIYPGRRTDGYKKLLHNSRFLDPGPLFFSRELVSRSL